MIDWVSRQAWTEEQNVHFKKNWQLYCLVKDTPDFVVSLKLYWIWRRLRLQENHLDNLVKRVRVYMKLYSLYYNQRSQQGHFWGTDHDHHANAASLKVLISHRTTRDLFQENGGGGVPRPPTLVTTAPNLGILDRNES